MIKKACYEKDEKEIKEKMGSKCEDIKNDEFKVQDYMKNNTVKDISEIFRIKTKMNHLRGNFSSDPKFRGPCSGCGVNKETNSHVTECEAYEYLLLGRDLSDDGDLVGFFRDVMRRREDKEAQLKA